MRHAVLEEPVSRAAVWSARIASFAIVVAAIGVLLARTDRIEPSQGQVVLLAAFAVAGLAILAALIGLSAVWREGFGGAGRAFLAIGLAGALIAYPSYLMLRRATLPAISDISTDLNDPPAFSLSRASREARGDRLLGAPDPETRTAQRAAYEGIAPVTLERSPEDVFAIARDAARGMGWRIVESSPPGGRAGAASIEAVDLSFLLRFPDDITIRIRPLANGARIDVRSASRYGGHDFGANARRVQRYLREVSSISEAK